MSVPVLRTPLETPCAPNPDVAVSADAAHPDVVAVIQVWNTVTLPGSLNYVALHLCSVLYLKTGCIHPQA
jgi:hypothetical protein